MGTRVDGKLIAEEIKHELVEECAAFVTRPELTVFVLVSDLATEKFIGLKQKFAADIGIPVSLVRLPKETTTETLVEAIKAVPAFHGVIVQFPLPAHVDRDVVRNAIPAAQDVDLISDAALQVFEQGTSKALPPVVGAMHEILKRYGVSLANKRVVVVGEGRLVGRPAAAWARLMGAHVKTVHEHSEGITETIKQAEVLILGAGSPGFITPALIEPGVVIIDAGTSEAAGKLAGDMDPACAEYTSLYTPVPGGVGPVTVAMIFKNLLYLIKPRT